MPLTIPPELKKITQYVRRAEELDKDSSPQTRIVAYYCRQYAIQVGISLAKTPPAKISLSGLLGDLEKEKVAMSNFSKPECYQVCRGFAFKIFDKADAEDRAGVAGKGTAKTFYAAATFLDILKQFHSNDNEEEKSDDELEEEKKSFYSKWKSTEILKAIKEGREPTPGGYGQDDKEEEDAKEEEAPVVVEAPQEPEIVVLKRPEEVDIPKAPVFVPPPPPPVEEPYSIVSFMESVGGMLGVSQTSKITKSQMLDGKELCLIALKALESKNGALAGRRLNEALVCLGQTPAEEVPSNAVVSPRVTLSAEKALKALESKDGKLAVDKIQEALVNLGFT